MTKTLTRAQVWYLIYTPHTAQLSLVHAIVLPMWTCFNLEQQVEMLTLLVIVRPDKQFVSSNTYIDRRGHTSKACITSSLLRAASSQSDISSFAVPLS